MNTFTRTASSDSTEYGIRLAESCTNPADLVCLTRDPRWQVRAAAAANVHTPLNNIVTVQKSDQDPFVREAARDALKRRARRAPWSYDLPTAA